MAEMTENAARLMATLNGTSVEEVDRNLDGLIITDAELAAADKAFEAGEVSPTTNDATTAKKKRVRKTSAFGTVPFPERIEESAECELNDFGFAERIAIHYEDRLMYVESSAGGGSWYVYTGRYWKEDTSGNEVLRCARIVAACAGNEELDFVLAKAP